jgi:S1-C subfamily serine protease
MTPDSLEQFSEALADRLAAAASFTVAIRTGRRDRSGILWRDDVVVTSDQVLPEGTDFSVVRDGVETPARLAGRDPGTNVAVLRLAQDLGGGIPDASPTVRAGSLVLVVGADLAGAPTGRLGMVHATGPAWHSMAGGRIDTLLRLDARLGSDEGGPVLTLGGKLIGMSTSGPRRRALAIPAATVERVLDPLLTDGRIARGWLGVALQAVAVPDALREAAGQSSGLMVMSVVEDGPAARAGIVAGDIILSVDGISAYRFRRIAGYFGSDSIGRKADVRLIRSGKVITVQTTIAERPAHE